MLTDEQADALLTAILEDGKLLQTIIRNRGPVLQAVIEAKAKRDFLFVSSGGNVIPEDM